MRPALFDEEYDAATLQDDFNTSAITQVAITLFAPLLDIGSVLGIEREMSVNRTAFVHGMYGGFHLDNIALMLQMRGGRFRVVSHSGVKDGRSSCLDVGSMHFTKPHPKRITHPRSRHISWTTTPYRARPGAHIFRVTCTQQAGVTGEYTPGSRVVLADRWTKPADAPELEVINVDLHDKAGPIGSSDALMQHLFRVMQEKGFPAETWAVMTPEQAASFDRALQLGFPPSDDRVGAFGAAVVEQFVGGGDWRGLADKAVAAHVGQRNGTKLLKLPRQTAATYNAWVEYIEALFVPITAVCQYAAATAPLTSADQMVFVVVEPVECNTLRVLFEAMGAKQAAAHDRRVKQKV